MAICYTEWKVLPHKPIVEASSRLWHVEGVMESGTRRIMSIVRLDDGRLLLHNAIALEDEFMAKIDAWGEVAGILVPNAYHRMDCRIMQARYPNAKVYAPAAAAKAVGKATPVHGTYADAPQGGAVRVVHLPGVKDREGVVEIDDDDGLGLVLNDVVMNMRKLGFPMSFLLGPTGRMSVPALSKWFVVSDKAAFRAGLQRYVDAGVQRLVPGHGAVVDTAAHEPLRGALEIL